MKGAAFARTGTGTRDAAGMQRLALGLLLLMAALYVLALTQQARQPAWAWVAAFAEAAMVGAIADWFAVVALFRHPLGLPIPHTAIIPAGKQRIGENLGQFITTHFLSQAQVMDKLRELDVAARVAAWLSRPENAARVATHLLDVGRWATGALRDARVQQFVTGLARRGLAQIDITRLSGQVLQAMTHERRHQQLLDAALLQLARLLGEDTVQDTISDAIAREVRALKYVGLDQVAARLATRKVVAITAHTIIDMAQDPQHALRLRFDHVAADFVERLKSDEALHARGERLKAELLASPAVGQYVNALWGELLDWLHDDMGRADSSIRQRIEQAAHSLGERLAGDAHMRGWINGQLQAAAPALIDRWREDIRRYIAARVQAWDTREMSEELERHIGRDLQFIRINGTLVGGLVGLCLHAITQWAMV
ncbi:MAG: DUF445 domain-containing protein [Pseudomonadota bacterium]|nr:DUF445 domain-containing protein [Pseudomonadota bacterium]